MLVTADEISEKLEKLASSDRTLYITPKAERGVGRTDLSILLAQRVEASHVAGGTVQRLPSVSPLKEAENVD
jgi:hypothetical protein